MTTVIQPVDPTDERVRGIILDMWNDACGANLAISRYLVEYNTSPATDVIQEGWLALHDARPVGFALASVWQQHRGLGWIDAIAVEPAHQRHGTGAALLGSAESWLRAQNCQHARLGGSMRPFAPGVPLELDQAAFFRQRGYNGDRVETDVARDLRDYETPAGVATKADVRLLQAEEVPALFEFLARAYPGRWEYEGREHFRAGGKPSDFLALWHGGRVEGFCYITTAGSLRPIERFFPHGLPQPWGQLGPLGVSREVRGQGYGVAMIDAALRHLRDLGTAGCVIDWTTLLDLYAKFGFTPFRSYAVLVKEL